MRAPKENPGKAPSWRAVPGCFHLSLVVQLQSKLNLPRIEWSIASRSYFAEVRISEVPRASDSHDAVSTEVWRVEVRVVEDVEELSSELHREPLVELESFEHREVEAMEGRSCDLTRLAAKSCRALQGEASTWRIRNRTTWPQLARLVECRCV